MPLTYTLDTPFYTGTSVSSEVPSRFDVALNGRPYMLDLESKMGLDQSFNHQTIALIRNQADAASSPSEASINPEDLWRRSQDTWHKGAGQAFLDRTDSDSARFHSSKGLDVWTKWQLGLLNDTDQKAASVNTNIQVLSVGSYLYKADGSGLSFTTDVTVDSPVWTPVTPGDGSTLLSICTDGNLIYAAYTGGVHTTIAGSITFLQSPYNALVSSLLRFVKGRLMAVWRNGIYNITSGSIPAALFTHGSSDFTWVDFSAGQAVMFAAGYTADKSSIYRITVVADGTTLSAPILAGELPDGEIVRSMQGYLGFQLIGTDKGVRVATEDASGNLTIGALIPTTSPVYAFEPQDRFCWYGLTNYDTTSTGLGRMDLSVLTAPGTPAYASDLMVTGQGAVVSIATFQNIRVFAVSGLGVYAETATPLASGTIDSGQITYRLPDKKVAMFVDVRHDLVGQHSVAMSVDGGPFVSLGTHTTSDSPFPTNRSRGLRFELRFTLTTVGVPPVLRSYTLRSYPAASAMKIMTAPLVLAERIQLHGGGETSGNPAIELALIDDLHASQQVVVYQEGGMSYSVTVDDYIWRPHNPTHDYTAWNGTCNVRMKRITE